MIDFTRRVTAIDVMKGPKHYNEILNKHQMILHMFKSMSADNNKGVLHNTEAVTYAKCILSVATEGDFSKTKNYIGSINTHSAPVKKKRKINSTDV